MTEEDITTYQLQRAGQQALVDRYTQALEQRRLRATATASDESIDTQLAPYRAKLKSLHNQLRRLKEQQARGILRAPFDGKVLDIEVRIGEYCEPGQGVASLVQSSSTELVVYLPQAQASRVKPGQRAKIRVQSSGERVRCLVHRVGTRYDTPAAEVQTYYAEHQQTLPVFLVAEDRSQLADLPLGTPVELLSVRNNRSSPNGGRDAKLPRQSAAADNSAPRSVHSSRPAL